MTRDEFTKGFGQRLRHVLQKHASEIEARERKRRTGDYDTLAHANAVLDGAITEFGAFVADYVEDRARVAEGAGR